MAPQYGVGTHHILAVRPAHPAATQRCRACFRKLLRSSCKITIPDKTRSTMIAADLILHAQKSGILRRNAVDRQALCCVACGLYVVRAIVDSTRVRTAVPQKFACAVVDVRRRLKIRCLRINAAWPTCNARPVIEGGERVVVYRARLSASINCKATRSTIVSVRHGIVSLRRGRHAAGNPGDTAAVVDRSSGEVIHSKGRCAAK